MIAKRLKKVSGGAAKRKPRKVYLAKSHPEGIPETVGTSHFWAAVFTAYLEVRVI